MSRTPLAAVTISPSCIDGFRSRSAAALHELEVPADFTERIVCATGAGLSARLAEDFMAGLPETAETIVRAQNGRTFHEVIVDQGRAVEVLAETARTLVRHGHSDVASLVVELFPRTVSSVVKGHRVSPAHHIPHVMNFAAAITCDEAARDPERAKFVRPVVLAAMMHDIGLGDSVLPKIAESMVAKAPPDEREGLIRKGIESRLEHMRIGEALAKTLLSGMEELPDWERQLVFTTVARHDYSKIPLLDAANPRKWLLPATGEEAWALQLHWEADALWMLTLDGLEIDLARESIERTPLNFMERLHYNLSLHRSVVDFYRSGSAPDPWPAYGFSDFGHLYRSPCGIELASKLVSIALAEHMPQMFRDHPGVLELLHSGQVAATTVLSGPDVRAVYVTAGLLGIPLPPAFETLPGVASAAPVSAAAYRINVSYPKLTELPFSL